MIFIDDLLGIPYKLHGRDARGYDCYGLVIEVLKRFGFELDDLDSYTKETLSKCFKNETNKIILKNNLKRVSEPKESDIVLFFDRGIGSHVGVCLGKNKFIHCDALGVRITSLTTYNKRWEVYRWQK